MDKEPTAIVRILTPKGATLGAGFLADRQGLVLTCAHVVGEWDEVLVEFPLLDAQNPPRYRARVEFRDEAADLAGLRLAEAPPDVAPLRLIQSGTVSLWGHPFRAFGFPAGHPQGTWAHGTLRAPVGSGWLQLEAEAPGFAVQSGFSGTPVWDEELQGVVGMVAQQALEREARVAFWIPVEDLLKRWPHLAKAARAANPYRGLAVFREQDASFFFGRERFVAEYLRPAVERRNFVPLIGPSGAGKSSVVRAGLFPHLRREADWLLAVFRPGGEPFSALAQALMPLWMPQTSPREQLREAHNLAQDWRQSSLALAEVVRDILRQRQAARLLLLADQFEEVFTLHRPVKGEAVALHRAFLGLLLDAVEATREDRALTLLLTLRADFMGRALEHPRLAAAFNRDRPLHLGPMTEDELRRAIVEPARKQGVRFEEGLPERMLEDLQDLEAALPLLEFTLSQLWKRQEAGLITLKAYQDLGGVTQALARHADKVYESLSEEEQRLAERIFIQLVMPGRGTEDTRRVAPLAEFSPAARRLIRKLADKRLVVTRGRKPTPMRAEEH